MTFLALLELLSQQQIHLIQGEGINNFWLTIPEESEQDLEGDQETEEPIAGDILNDYEEE